VKEVIYLLSQYIGYEGYYGDIVKPIISFRKKEDAEKYRSENGGKYRMEEIELK